ncbi:hypothetical protein NST63_26160 [Heyndrickxia sp. FSL W8-0496]|uniref:hypothetical protein n=1 Tax=Heyndrickxia TaxID=2837504 RepID=UPI000A755CB1|nr:hypothetical protein J19TS1_30340 [Heyndrickxia oleronia]
MIKNNCESLIADIENVNLIFVINQGEIIEGGTHHELLQKKGFYSPMYESQFNI